MTKNPNSTIREVKSVFSLMPEDQEHKIQIIKEIRDLVDKNEKFVKAMGTKSMRFDEFKTYLHSPPVTLQDIPEEFLVEFRDPAGNLGSFVVVYPKGEEAEMKEMTKHAAEVREVRAPSGKTYYSSGESIIFSDMFKLMKVDGRRAIILTFISIFLIILLQTRSLKNTLVVLTPLYIGVLMICGIMVLFDIKLNFFNIIIFPMLLGIGIDSNVHIFERFLEFGGKDVHGAMRSTGRGILLTTVTTIIGFWSLLFAKSKALNSVGILAVAGVITCCLTAFTVLPVLMSMLKFRNPDDHQAEESNHLASEKKSHMASSQ
jgi:predicted RND superfamily exporter protein